MSNNSKCIICCWVKCCY